MSGNQLLSGYGPPKNRLLFDGDEDSYELWETKFIAHLHLRDLAGVIDATDGTEVDQVKNKKIYSELVLLLDDVSLSLVMRDAKDDGHKAMSILRAHYLGKSKPRIISLYFELASLKKGHEETVTDYVLRAEGASAALKSADEKISDSLLIAMCLRGLPPSFNSFATVMTQRDDDIDFVKFKGALRSFEESEKSRLNYDRSESDNILFSRNPGPLCFSCNKHGHKQFNCPNNSQFKTSNKGPHSKFCFKCKSSSHYTNQCSTGNRGRGRGFQHNNRTSAKYNVNRDDEEEEHTFSFKLDFGDVGENEESEDILNECLIVDSGATAHLCYQRENFINFD